MARVELDERDLTTGRRRRKYVYGTTRAAVAEKLNALLGKKSTNELLATATPTIASWLNVWWDTQVAAGEWSLSTMRLYRYAIDLWIVPGIGPMRLERIKPLAIQKWLTASGAREKTHIARCVLSQALTAAMRHRLITWNPVHTTKLARRSKRPITRLTAVQARSVIEAARHHPLGAAIITAFAMGLRIGEICGLPWRNIDLAAGTMTIDQQAQSRGRWGGLTVERKVKTTHSERTLAIPAVVLEGLKRRRAVQLQERMRTGGTWKNPHDLVFTRAHNDRIIRPEAMRKAMNDLLAVCKVDHVKFHATRHTAATLLLESGTPLFDVSRLLGHSELATTADIYGEFTPKMAANAATRMDKILGGKRGGK